MKKLGLNENFICRIWENESYYTGLKTCKNEPVEILDYGKKNSDAGPDYKDAKVKISGVTYSGSIEIHRSEKDWYLHNHKGDNKYNDLILHVVFYENDPGEMLQDPKVRKSRSIPTVILSEHLTRSIHEIWKEIINNPSPSFKLPCFPENKIAAHSVKTGWLNKLSIIRLKEKSERFKFRLAEISWNQNKKVNWEQVLFEFICEALGYSKNKKQFLKLSKNIELNEIKKLNPDRTEIDSLLYGNSGFLYDLRYKDKYIEELKSTWAELKKIFKKEIMNKSEWNFFRLRPPNFPSLRIAFASGLLFEIIYNDLLKDIVRIFEDEDNIERGLVRRFKLIRVSEYWNTHYNFGKESGFQYSIIGNERIKDIISNVILPVMHLYSISFNKDNLKKRVEYFYRKGKQKSGSNEITRIMEKQLDVKVNSLADEQALIQLHNCYCVANLDRHPLLFHGIAIAQVSPYRAKPDLFRPASRSPLSWQTGYRFHPGAGSAGRWPRSRRRRRNMCGRSRFDDLLRLCHQLFVVLQKRKYGAFDRRNPRMKTQHDSRFHFTLFIRRLVFGIGFADQRQHRAIDPGARLDHMRNEFLFCFFIEIFQRLSARFLVLRQIVIGPVSHAFQLLPTEREIVLDVVSSLGIKSAFRIRHGQHVQFVRGDPDCSHKT